jgi:Fe-S-cluster containining protein
MCCRKLRVGTGHKDNIDWGYVRDRGLEAIPMDIPDWFHILIDHICPHLDENNLCGVHHYKCKSCLEYPASEYDRLSECGYYFEEEDENTQG